MAAARATLSLKSIVRGAPRYHTSHGHYLFTPDVCLMLTLPEKPEFDLIAPMPDHDLWMAFFRDIDGNRHALMSEVPRR
jgi:hypothetical protein